MDLNTETGESLLQLEIRKCQQAFAMSTHDEPEEFEDIQFFHRIPPVALQSFKVGGAATSTDIMRGGYLNHGSVAYNDGQNMQESNSSYAFPENVLEYGEPQFFPGNCVGYLETILEETDEDCEEEEGSSGRHWCFDSDTDTDSVIRNDNNNPTKPHPQLQLDKLSLDSMMTKDCLLSDFLRKPSEFHEPIGRSLSESSSPPFRTTASSKPFEMEDLYLFDQLDLAFEETLMKPRRRTGFAFEADLSLPPLEESLPLQPCSQSHHTFKSLTQSRQPISTQPHHEKTSQSKSAEFKVEKINFEGMQKHAEPNSEEAIATLDLDDENEGPAVVNEEDFFYSSPSSSSSEGENSGLSETETSEGSSESSEEDKKSGIVLAEFNLQSNGHGDSEIYKNNNAQSYRRSYESPSSKIRSFRSFDSLNSLGGTELLFSSPDTFPAPPTSQFGLIQEVVEEAQCSGSRSSRSSSTEDKVEVSRKNSGEASSENLSEDSGIHELQRHASLEGPTTLEHERNFLQEKIVEAMDENCAESITEKSQIGDCVKEKQASLVPEDNFVPKDAHGPFGQEDHYSREFALNPFVYSSASEEASITTTCSSMDPYKCSSQSETSFSWEDQGVEGEAPDTVKIQGSNTRSPSSHLNANFINEGEDDVCNSINKRGDNMRTVEEPVVNNCNGQVESGSMSALDFHFAERAVGDMVISKSVSGKEGVYESEAYEDSNEFPQAKNPLENYEEPHHHHLHSHHEVDEVNETSRVDEEDEVRELFEEGYHTTPSISHQYSYRRDEEQEHPLNHSLPHNILHNDNPPLPFTPKESILSECQPLSNFGSSTVPFLHTFPCPPFPSEGTRNREKNSVSCESRGSVSILSSTGPHQQSQPDPHYHVNTLENHTITTMEVQQQSNSPIPIKTYGGILNNDVEVYLVTHSASSGSRTASPSPTAVASSPGLAREDSIVELGSAASKTKSVHFCPVVSEISWRESYAEPSSEEADSPYHGASGKNSHQYQSNGQTHEYEYEHDSHNNREPIEKVHVHTQVIPEPLPMVIPKSEKERLLALEPALQGEDIHRPEPMNMRMSSAVPDLLSQVQNSNSHDEVDAYVSREPAAPYHYQQQIFPSMFVASAKEVAGAKAGSNRKNGKKSSYVAPPLAPTSHHAVHAKEVAKVEPASPKFPSNKSNGKRSPEKEADTGEKVKSKPGFFQRLTKIRLSGSKPKQPKRIYPKEIEPLNLNSNLKVTDPSPILKKSSLCPVVLHSSPTSSSTQPQLNGNGTNTKPKEHDECSEAFENILEEIAGLNTILLRQQFPPQSSTLPGKRSFAERKQFLTNQEQEQKSSTLDTKLSQFKEEATKKRDQISRSHPDLETIEGATRRTGVGDNENQRQSMIEELSPRATNPETKKNEREWYRLLRSAAEKYYHGGRKSENGAHKTGIVETDLDTGTSRELLDAELVTVDDLDLSLGSPPLLPSSLPPPNGAKAQSLTNLRTGLKLSIAPDDPSNNGIDDETEERAKSLEFLLDDDSKTAASPPENQLRQDNRQLSEHELRIQRSLQKINVPDWYRKHSYRSTSVDRSDLRKDTPLASSSGTAALKLLKDRSDYGSAGGLAGGWAGLSAYRTPSLSSLQNSGRYTGSLNRSNFVRGIPSTMSAMRSSRESLLSPSSTASQSPSAFDRSSFTYGMPLTLTRFGKSRLSSGTSPGSVSPSCSSVQSTLSTYVKKPYLGWRSQEKLNGSATLPTNQSGGLRLSTYRPPAERLAADMLIRHKKSPVRPTGSDRPPLPKPMRESPAFITQSKSYENSIEPTGKISPTIHDSIREVTDAIKDFVAHGNEGPPKPAPRQRNVKKQALWFESSFVGKSPRNQNQKQSTNN